MPDAPRVLRFRLWLTIIAALWLASPELARAAPPEPLERGHEHQAGARFEDAAAAYEQFVAEQPEHPEAPAALENAYLIRVGLGQDTEALADLDEYQRLYARERPEQAAALFWSRHDQLKRGQERRDHALAYLKQHGRRGGLDRALVAEAVIAQIDWRRSCDEPLLLDMCVSRARRRALPALAYESTETTKTHERDWWLNVCHNPRGATTVHSRDRKLGKAARARIDRILAQIGDASEIEIPSDDPERARAFADAWAMALIYRTDAKFEALLRREPPSDLEFGVEEWRKHSQVPEFERIYARQVRTHGRSMAKLDAFIATLTEAGDALELEYGRVAAAGSVTWALAAQQRIAELRESLADVIAYAWVPDYVETSEQFRSHCAVMSSKVEPLRARALDAWLACSARSFELQVDDEFSRACVDRLAEIDPFAYPPTYELLAEPTFHAGGVTSIGVVGPVP